MRNKILAVFCFLISCVSIACLGNHLVIDAQAQAQAEIAMDLKTGTVLTASGADAKLPMASTTKIMTAIIVIEDCNLDEIVTVPDEAVGVEGSSIYLKYKEELDIRDLLYGLMLRSGNDSATALAIIHSGSVENFVNTMNERATKMGANNTHFCNPSGLPDNDHYTTAEDLCKIARYAMQNDTFKQIVSTKSYTGNYRSFVNKNKMLDSFEGANGIKTGYTVNAGRCLVSSAERGGMDVICVVLNCPDMYERSSQILNSCFENYELKEIANNKIFMCGEIPCKLKETQEFIVERNGHLEYQTEKTVKTESVHCGDTVGKLKIFSQNNLIFDADLYSIVDR